MPSKHAGAGRPATHLHLQPSCVAEALWSSTHARHVGTGARAHAATPLESIPLPANANRLPTHASPFDRSIPPLQRPQSRPTRGITHQTHHQQTPHSVTESSQPLRFIYTHCASVLFFSSSCSSARHYALAQQRFSAPSPSLHSLLTAARSAFVPDAASPEAYHQAGWLPRCRGRRASSASSRPRLRPRHRHCLLADGEGNRRRRVASTITTTYAREQGLKRCVPSLQMHALLCLAVYFSSFVGLSVE